MNVFYYLFFGIIYFSKLIGLYDGQKLFYAFVIVGLIFYAIKMVTTKMTPREYLICALLMGISVISYYFSGEKGLILFMAVATGMKGIDARKVMKLAFVLGTVTYGAMIIITSLGLIPDGYHVTSKFAGLMMIRRQFGQPGANVAHTVFFMLVALLLYFYGNREHVFALSLLVMLINMYLFLYTMSFTGALSVALMLILNLALRKKKAITSKTFAIICNVLYSFLIILSIVLPAVLTGRLYDIFNTLLNHRIEYGQYFLQNEKITLFGSRFAEAPNGNFYLDNAYLYLFLQLGVVTFVITIALMYLTLNGILKSGDIGAFVIFAAFSFIGLSDPFLFNTSFKNLIFVFAGAYLFKLLSGDERDALIRDSGGEFGAVFDFFDSCPGYLVVIFIVLPMLGIVCFYLNPALYEHALLGAGDRLSYYTESEVYLNKELDQTIAILRTGAACGIVVSGVLCICKLIYDKRKKGKLARG